MIATANKRASLDAGVLSCSWISLKGEFSFEEVTSWVLEVDARDLKWTEKEKNQLQARLRLLNSESYCDWE